jgi:signal transduction histidine kinase
MMGYVDVLRRGAMQEPALASKILETMGDEGGRMRSLIDKLLALARLEDLDEPHDASIDVAAMVADVVESIRRTVPDRTLTWTAAPGVTAFGEESELRAALVNLIDNAIKYAPGSPVDVSVVKDDESVQVTVSDGGPGMTVAERAHAFDRFYRGENRASATGAGLGLAIVRRTVERAGGSVDLETAPGTGTRVTMRLRAAAT